MEKTKGNCIHFWSTTSPNRCRILRDDVYCDPKTCAWHRTANQMMESFETARKNFERRNGFDGYYKQPNVVPRAFIFYAMR